MIVDIDQARSDLEDVKASSENLSSEIESKMDALDDIKTNLDDGISQLDGYLDALQGIQETLDALDSAKNEAEYHDISY